MGVKVLFLGPPATGLADWLIQQGEDVVQTEAPLDIDFVKQSGVQFLVSYGYRHILRQPVLDLFPGRAINLHISYLPWNRGADPNLWSIIDNTPKGVTIHHIDAGLDTGDVVDQKHVEINPDGNGTLATSYQLLNEEIQNLFKSVWPKFKAGQIVATPQSGAGTEHRMVDKEKINHLLSDGWDTKISDLGRRK